jgi:hypothetical protein
VDLKIGWEDWEGKEMGKGEGMGIELGREIEMGIESGGESVGRRLGKGLNDGKFKSHVADVKYRDVYAGTSSGNNNRFTGSGTNGVFGFTGQRRVAPAVGEQDVEPTRPSLIHEEEVCLVDPSFLNSNPRLVATSQEAV